MDLDETGRPEEGHDIRHDRDHRPFTLGPRGTGVTGRAKRSLRPRPGTSSRSGRPEARCLRHLGL